MKLARRQRAQAVEEAPMPPAGSDAPDGTTQRRVLRANRVEDVPAPEPPKARKGRIRTLLDEQVAESREHAEHEAALELNQFMEPARQQLVLNVPGSSSPEEAEAMLTSQASKVLGQPVEVSPETVVDLRNPSSMRAYPPAEKLSNRVLRLADRHWAKDKKRSPAEIMAAQAVLNEQEFARRPTGTQRCLALRGSLRCRGVFVYRADQQADGSIIGCPSCGAAHSWDPAAETWVLGSEAALGAATHREAVTTGT